jgi:catechol 2,3-dioxygenase-like lactoylglutathione lyase family enzyme
MIRLDHATINTVDLTASVSFYRHYLGLSPGWRPAVSIGGAWLYPEGGDYPIVHLIARKESLPKGGMFDHIAFRSKDLRGYLRKLKSAGAWHAATPVPGTKLVQVHHHDPNGVLIEVNFEDEPLDTEETQVGELVATEATTSNSSSEGRLE